MNARHPPAGLGDIQPRLLTPDVPDYPSRLRDRFSSRVPPDLSILGSPLVLDLPLLGVLSSSRTPADVVLPTLDLMARLRSSAIPVIGGFHTQMERPVLPLLLRGRGEIAICPAVTPQAQRVPAGWIGPMMHGRLTCVSLWDARTRRANIRLALRRNTLLAALAQRLFIAHADPTSRVFRTARESLEMGIPVSCFDHRSNRDLMLMGAEPVQLQRLDCLIFPVSTSHRPQCRSESLQLTPPSATP